MGRIDKTVFLSYRRTNIGYALAIYQKLTAQGYDVFFDYNSIHSGDFEQIILNNIESRAHFIVLLTPSALERVHEAGDWLRREIEYAIETQRNIIPLTMEGFDWKYAQSKLTGKLAPLGSYNALSVPVDYFDEAMNRLISRFLNIPIDAVIHPRNPMAERAATKIKTRLSTQPEVDKAILTSLEWCESGHQKWESGDIDGAIEDTNIAIQVDALNAIAFNNRGRAHKAKGDLDSAIKDFTKAIRLNPDYAVAYNNRGSVYYRKGNFDAAILDYTKAISLDPNYATAFNNRGSVYHAEGDLDNAIQDFTEAIRLNPDYTMAYYNRGIVYWSKGYFDKCVIDWQMILEIDPYHKKAQEWLPKAQARL